MNDEYKYTKTLAIIFIVFLIVMVCLNTYSKDKDFSETENRVLASKPKFTFERLFDGRFTKKYEKYKVDQFVGRDFFVDIKSRTDLLIGKRDNNGVYYGDDGYLLESFNPMDSSEIQSTIASLNNFSTKYKDINSYIAVAPNSINILKDKLPKFAPVIDQEIYLNKLESNLNENIKYIDISQALKTVDDEYIFYKTDHHWTSLGAYISFLTIKDDMHLEGNNTYYEVKMLSNDFNGTLSSKSAFRKNIYDNINAYIPTEDGVEIVVNFSQSQKKTPSLYSSKQLESKDKYSVFLEGNHPILEITTTANTDKELLLIKDSYANAFIPFLVDYYSKIIVVDPRYYYDDLYSLVDTNNISDILFLYNANTFFSDTSLAPVLNNE